MTNNTCTCGHPQESHSSNGECGLMFPAEGVPRICSCAEYLPREIRTNDNPQPGWLDHQFQQAREAWEELPEWIQRGLRSQSNDTAATIASLQARIAELERQQDSAIRTFHEIEQALGRALHYPRYSDDPKSFPGATDADGVCVGEHVPETLAAEAAQRIATLEAEAKAAIRFLANESLMRENDALKQRVAELERDYKHKCEAKDCYYDCVEKKSANREIAEAQEQAWKVVRPFVEEKDATIAAQQQRISELEADAARLDWVEAKKPQISRAWGGWNIRVHWPYFEGDTLRQAIDAARAAENQTQS